MPKKNTTHKLLLPCALLVLVLIALWMIKMFENKTPSPVPQTLPVQNSDTVVYTNPAYGWRIAYPSKYWKTAPSTDASGIILTSIQTAVAGPKQTEVAVATVQISTVKKADFKPVRSKKGNINYDLNLDALVDTSNSTPICMSPHPTGPNNLMPQFTTFEYDGNSMSDPAYTKIAVMTNQDYLVLISTNSWEPIDISFLSSLQLAPGVTSPLPACIQH